MRPRDGLPLRVEARGELIVRRGTVEAVFGVVLAGPDHLHRRVHRFRDTHRFGHEIGLEPPSEPAAQERRVDTDLFLRQARGLSSNLLRPGLILRWRPHFAAVGAHVSRAVHRLHRGVMKEGNFVHRCDLLRGSGERSGRVAVATRLDACLTRERRELCGDVAECGIGAFVPGDLQGPPSLDRLPVGIGDDGHTTFGADAPCALHAGPGNAVELHNVPHAGQRLRRGRVEARHFPAEHWRALDAGDEHARHPHVDSELRRSVHFGRRVETMRTCANEAEVFGILERRVLRDRNRRRLLRQLAVRQPVAGMRHRTIRGLARRGVHAPGLRGGGDEHRASGRTGLAENVPRGPHTRAAACRHATRPASGIFRHRPDLHLRPVDIELFRDDHREGGVIPFAHFGLVERHGDGAVRVDPQPCVGCEGRHAMLVRNPEPEQQSRPDRPGDLEKVAPLHQASFAARWIAARMRW